MPTLIFIRHGDYDYRDPTLPIFGQGLTAKGAKQAEATASWLARGGFEVSAIQSSDFTRAQQTASILASALPGVPLATLEHLRECPSVYFKERGSVSPLALEAYDQLFGGPAGRLGAVVVVCHANLIRYLLSRRFNWSRGQWEATTLGNCSVSIVETGTGARGRAELVSLAVESHLPMDLRESL